MKKERVFESEMVAITSTITAGQKKNEKTPQPGLKAQAETGKLVWKGSPLSKDLLMRLIERVQGS